MSTTNDAPPHRRRFQPIIITLTMLCIAFYMLTSHFLPDSSQVVTKTRDETRNGTGLRTMDSATPAPIPSSTITTVTVATRTLPSTTTSTAINTSPPTTAPVVATIPAQTNNPIDYNHLLNKLRLARRELEDSLRQDYGSDNFARIFQATRDDGTTSSSVRRWLDLPGGASLQRMKERLQRKILYAALQSSSDTKVPFVWVQGGHSSAAGHGNFIPESQTAVLEKKAKPIFDALNIEFIGRNYAMGGTASGLEIAACSKELFGTDLDVLCWDFGMTDGNEFERMELYFIRASLQAGQPALVAMHISGTWEKYRIPLMQQLDAMGLTALYMNRTIDENMEENFPDTFGKSQAEIDQMPPYVRYYKCDGKIEKGDPGCNDHKYNESFCVERPFKAPWHPGWKYHARTGNALALYLAELLEESLIELSRSAVSPPEKLALLEQEHNRNYEQFQSAPMSQSLIDLFTKASDGGIDPRVIVYGPNICRTGRLPSQARFQGLVTNNGELQMRPMTYVEALASPNPEPLMRLVRGISKRPAECDSFLFQHDYKHYFMTSYADQGTKHLVLPNARERTAYSLPSQLVGYVAVCLSNCAWGKCPEGDIRFADVFNRTDAALVQVNGMNVTGFVTILKDCDFLRHEGGYVWPLPDQGTVDISARVLQEGGFMRFMSTVVW